MDKVFLFELKGKKYYYDWKMFMGQGEKIPVSVRSLSKTNETYHPARVTYTGITIGGVHTGSVNVQDAHYTFTGSKTSRGQISIDGITDATELYLSDELVKEAEKNPKITKWFWKVQPLRLRIEPPQRLNQSQLHGMLSGADVSGQTSYLNNEVDKHYNIQYCVAVCDFIAKALDGAFLTDEQRKGLEEVAIEHLTNSKKPEDWNLVKNYLSKHTEDWAKEIVKNMDEKLAPFKKYEIDGLVFSNKKDYDDYLIKKRIEQQNKKQKRIEAIAMIIGVPAVIGFVYLLMLAFGWI